ncbi:hypothetical protein JDV02_006098 [Purpureocillium takamizusanense]|uniref:Uncharacterized protein n=1 Tax=Purpureocillium takamizusanense TaxID=2060973 RepID=A0A9Q8VCE6_9HYPO|nr:uncharacterized protein JDV02_006098 [Purpureocillium takamizusanense]UNI19956.1 hypothetical protein JDV02_006098 [Purpureocillium takamizusanense]
MLGTPQSPYLVVVASLTEMTAGGNVIIRTQLRRAGHDSSTWYARPHARTGSVGRQALGAGETARHARGGGVGDQYGEALINPASGQGTRAGGPAVIVWENGTPAESVRDGGARRRHVAVVHRPTTAPGGGPGHGIPPPLPLAAQPAGTR